MRRILEQIHRRLSVVEVFVLVIFLFLWITLFQVIYQKRFDYQKKLKEMTEVIVEGESAPRGRIYDRNYRLLVDNVSVPVIY